MGPLRISVTVIAVAAAFAVSIHGTAISLAAQIVVPPFAVATMPPENERNPRVYTLKPEGRDGPSVFPRTRHSQVEYEAGAVLTFDKYHTVDVMDEWLRRWAERFPGIVELYQAGTSYEGRPIMQVTLTNKSTGPATDKPAAFFEGGRHSGEITSSESVLWLIKHLVEGYGRDTAITRLLNRAAIHLRPQNNPDGSNLYLHTAQTNRSSVRPHDQDGDGLFDEDPPQDLDGDGAVTQMRWRDPAGDWRVDPRDPSGRIMVRAIASTPPAERWSTASEGSSGLDADRDGRSGEDGIGGLDLHRNYPMNWRPMPGLDQTGRGWTQGGAGAYPLSEPETAATVLFTLYHPNVAVVNSMDTRVPMHLRPPSTSRGEESMFREDLALYQHFDSVGLTITKYPWAGDVYHTYATRSNPTAQGSPLFGHGPDFGYFQLGAIWYGDELWDGGVVGDVNGDGVSDDLDRLIWQDSVANGNAFVKWTPSKHPVYGDVEVGGWHPKFFSQNGPPEVLDKWAGNQALFNLYMAKNLPDLEVLPPRVTRSGGNSDSTTWEVRVQVRNNAFIPTALKQADLVKIVRPDRIRLLLDGLTTTGANPQARILGEGNTATVGYIQGRSTAEATFTVRTYGTTTLRGNVEVISTRGGVHRTPWSAPGVPQETERSGGS